MKDFIKKKNIYFKSINNLKVFQRAIRDQYEKTQNEKPNLIDFDLTKEIFFEDLKSLVEEEVKEYINRESKVAGLRDIVGTPGVAFYRNLLSKDKVDRSFRSYNLNACYLFAYGKLIDDGHHRDDWPFSYTNLGFEAPPEPYPIYIDMKYTIKLAEYDDIRRIHNIAATVYEGIDVIPTEKMLEWYNKNPYSFHVIVDEDHEVVGNIDILPLKDEALTKFLSSKIIEREIKADDIWGVDEKDKITSLYIESVVNKAGEYAVLSVLRAVADIFNGFDCDAKCIKKVYCISASPKGTRLIERLGFSMFSDGRERKDKHAVYVADISSLLRNVAGLLGRLEKYSDEHQKLLALSNEFDKPSTTPR